jgi:hypothetical protein
LGNIYGKHNLGDISMDRKMILKWILETAFNKVRLGSSGRLS